MTLIIPQGRKFMKKKALLIFDLETPEDVLEEIVKDGETSYYFLEDAENHVIYMNTKPFTLTSAREVYKYRKEEE
jgi:hypothetical protein